MAELRRGAGRPGRPGLTRGAARRLAALAAWLPGMGATACATSDAGRNPAGPAGTPPPLRSGTTLVFQSDGNAPGKLVVDAVVADWARRQPGIGIELIWAGADKLQASIAADTGPDVFALNDNLFAPYASRGTLLDLGPLLRRDRVDTSDIFTSSLQKWRLADKPYGLPRAYNTAVMYTNVTLFKQAGVAPPGADWKGPGWDFGAFLSACRSLTRRDGAETLQWGASLLNNVFYYAFIYANGGRLFSPDLTQCALTERPALDALQYLADLILGHRVALTPAETQATGGPRAAFNSGRCAMELFGSSNLNLYRQITGFEWDWIILPRGRAARASWGGGAGWAVGSYSRAQEEGWAFLRHLTSAESVTAMAEQYFPYRRSSLDALLARDPDLPPRTRRPVVAGMEVAEGWPAHPRREELQQALDAELRGIWTGERSPREGAEAARRAVEPLLR
jgi:ABC-type glycerol-3-phosphate transport system substrate-binding protein